MSARLRWPLVIMLSGALLGFLLLAGLHGPLRVVAALWFLLVCPGMAFAPLLPLPSRDIELVVGFVLSLILDTLVATAIAEIGGLSQTSGFLALSGLCLAGCSLQLLVAQPTEGTVSGARSP